MWDAARGTYIDWEDSDEDEWSNCSRTIDCCCEDCYQNYPERFDDEGNNLWSTEPDDDSDTARLLTAGTHNHNQLT